MTWPDARGSRGAAGPWPPWLGHEGAATVSHTANGDDDVNGIEVGRIVPGGVYRFHEKRVINRKGNRVIEDVEFDLYRVEGFGVDGMTRREVVVYIGLDGADAGRLFVCPPWDFVMKFNAVPEEKPEPLPEKMAGTIPTGSGV